MSSKVKWTEVFFDCETLNYNTIQASEKPSDGKEIEYSVSYAYEKRGKLISGVVNSFTDFLNILINEKPNNHFHINAHNGDGFDNWFLRKKLIVDFGLEPKNEYLSNSENHFYETYKKDIKDPKNYLLERHVKAKSKLAMKFAINGTEFETVDTYPKFAMSVKAIGKNLESIGVHQHKLAYKKEDYHKFDRPEDMSYTKAVKYSKECFNKLTEYDKQYVLNDTLTIYQAYKHYNDIYRHDGYKWDSLTLSVNIGQQYEISPLSAFQIYHKVPKILVKETKMKRLQYSLYKFYERDGRNISLYEYIHNYYNGGLNLYNDRYVGKILDLKNQGKHIDINSSYPTVMYYEQFPYKLVDYSTKPKLLKLEKRYLYLLEVTREWFDEELAKIPSKVIRAMFVKYYRKVGKNNVYITNETYNLICKFQGLKRRSSKAIPVESFMKWKGKRFSARSVISENYRDKNYYGELAKKAKKEGREEDAKEYSLIKSNKKVTLNGIYGIPALRSHFPLFELIDGEYINIKGEDGTLGFKNSERNILFSVFTTTYAFRNLITPLTYNVKGIDKGFIYTDTDSIFMTNDYWESIKDDVELDPEKLGAWDLEHHDIAKMYVLNHKKYCLELPDHTIEVHAGGIVLDDLHAEDYNNIEDFVKQRFSEGVSVDTTRSCLTKFGTINIYDTKVELKQGEEYPTSYNTKDPVKYMLEVNEINKGLVETAQELEENGNDDDTIYIESKYITMSTNDVLDYTNQANVDDTLGSIKDYVEDEREVIKYL